MTSNISDAERRGQNRHFDNEILLLEIIGGQEYDLNDVEVVAAQSIDLAPDGLKARVDRHIPEGRVIDLKVIRSDPPKAYFLTAEVRWCRLDQESGAFTLGLRLFDALNTDYRAWAAHFS